MSAQLTLPLLSRDQSNKAEAEEAMQPATWAAAEQGAGSA